MADPVTGTKTGVVLLALFGVAAQPLVGEWVIVFVCALAGSAVNVHLAKSEDMPRWWQPFTRFGVALLSGLVLSRAAAPLATQWLGESAALDPEAMLMAVAFVVSGLGPRGIFGGLQWLSERINAKRGEGQ
jgi:hypothetical protein